MIGYTTLGVRDVAKSAQFYVDLFESQEAAIKIDAGRIVFVGTKSRGPMIAVCTPYDGQELSVGNGSMVAFSASTKDEVDAMYARAIELGATCDGGPGQRVPDRFYGAYVRDLDGHKICFFVFG